MFEVSPLFPTPVGKIKYEHHENIKKSILNFIVDNPELEVDGITSVELKHFFNTSNKEEKGFFDYVDDLNFKQFLNNSAIDFMRYVMGLEVEDVVITDSWLNRCYEGGYQRFHSHANSFISGTYYINFDSENHSPLKFLNPNFGQASLPFMQLNTQSFTDFNHRETICNFIDEGSLILWPSHLDHGYDINMKDDRITLSMNIMPSELRSGPYSFKIQK